MESKHNSATRNETIADFDALIESQLGSISAFEACLDQTYGRDPALQEITSAIKQRLAINKDYLAKAKQARTWSPSTSASPQERRWGSISLIHAATPTTSATLTLSSVIGEPDRRFEIQSASQTKAPVPKAFVPFVTSVFSELEATELHIQRLAEMIPTLEQSCIRSPSETVDKHIGLLGQYNDVKDVGQQLIGLIAENRGVSVGTFYRDSQYGVDGDD